MKVCTNIKSILILDDEPSVGSLVKSKDDINATGMIVEFITKDEVSILWSVPPKIYQNKYGEIW